MGEYASRQAQTEDVRLLQKAEEAFVAALALDSEYVHAQLNLGAVHYERGRIGQAIDEFKRVLQIDPENEPARDNLQTLLEQQLDDRLLKQGLLTESRPPVTDFAPYQNRRLMRIRKKPLSKIVIEDRR
jgi:tetratricopeptide (TPR) repeat protein